MIADCLERLDRLGLSLLPDEQDDCLLAITNIDDTEWFSRCLRQGADHHCIYVCITPIKSYAYIDISMA
jgi:hypothetical protein